jgi:hypothetical protein
MAPIIAAVVGLGVMGSACTELSPSKERASDVYATVIRWFADHVDGPDAPPRDEPMKVFVEPRGEGSSINVDVQAEVVTAVEDVATVRFIDGRDEALETTEEGVTVVRDNGILIAFGPVPNDATDVTLELDQYLDETTVRTYRFALTRTGEVWKIQSQTSIDEPVTPDEE